MICLANLECESRDWGILFLLVGVCWVRETLRTELAEGGLFALVQ
jgi:hypothetical protein